MFQISTIYGPSLYNLLALISGFTFLVAIILLFIFGIKYVRDDEFSATVVFIIAGALMIAYFSNSMTSVASYRSTGVEMYYMINLIIGGIFIIGISICFLIYSIANFTEKGFLVLPYAIIYLLNNILSLLYILQIIAGVYIAPTQMFYYYNVEIIRYVILFIGSILLLVYGILVKNVLFSIAGGLISVSAFLPLLYYVNVLTMF